MQWAPFLSSSRNCFHVNQRRWNWAQAKWKPARFCVWQVSSMRSQLIFGYSVWRSGSDNVRHAHTQSLSLYTLNQPPTMCSLMLTLDQWHESLLLFVVHSSQWKMCTQTVFPNDISNLLVLSYATCPKPSDNLPLVSYRWVKSAACDRWNMVVLRSLNGCNGLNLNTMFLERVLMIAAIVEAISPPLLLFFCRLIVSVCLNVSL